MKKLTAYLSRRLLLLPSVLLCVAWFVSPKTAHAQTAVSTAAPAKKEATPARRVDDFLRSIGANSAVSRRGETLAKTGEAAKYLGLGWIRAGYESGIPVQDLISLHQQTGVRFSYGLGSGGTDLDRLLAGARQLADADALVAIEGPNEPNNWGVIYQGEAGGGKAVSWLAVAKLQRDLYRAIKNDGVLKKYPVWSISENGAQKDNLGLQFLTIPPGVNCLMPVGTRYADCANVHNYIYHPNSPGLTDNKTWNAADPSPACKVDGLYGNYGKTWGQHFSGYSLDALQNLPRVTTETGTTIGGAITEEIHALNLLTMYLDQFARGWSHTSVYGLRDRSDEGGNQKFGFYSADYTPRKAALYLHNLTTILGDSRAAKPSAATLTKWAYSIANQPNTVHDLLLQKSDGARFLLVWNERVSGDDTITVELGKTFPTLSVYDPTVGTQAVQTLSNQDFVTLRLSDHPQIIEIPAQTVPVR